MGAPLKSRGLRSAKAIHDPVSKTSASAREIAQWFGARERWYLLVGLYEPSALGCAL